MEAGREDNPVGRPVSGVDSPEPGVDSPGPGVGSPGVLWGNRKHPLGCMREGDLRPALPLLG